MLAAMRNVAMMLRKGQGMPKDPKAAEAMYRAGGGGRPAHRPGRPCRHAAEGRSRPPRPRRALPLLQAAAAANHPIAQYELAQMYEAGSWCRKTWMWRAISMPPPPATA